MSASMSGSTKGGGMCQAIPDVCKVPAPPAPPIPTPFPNMGQLVQATGTSTKVKFFAAEVVTIKSKIPMSQGDEAGVAGGVVSGQNMGPITFKKGSAKVLVEGAAVVYQSAITAHNGNNANAPAGMQQSPSQTKVLVSP